MYLCLSHQTDLSSLIAASTGGHTEIVDKLLKHGARVDHQTQVILSYRIPITSV